MNDCLYRKDLTLASDLSEEYRIYSLTLAIDELMEDKNNFIVGKIVVDNFQFTNTQYLEHDKLEQEYHELYGQNESVNIEAVNSLNKFPYVKYDATRKKIFYQTTGNKKETSTSEVIEYLNRLESDQNNVYAYISIAYTSTSTPNTLGVYTDKEKTNLYHNISISDYKKDEIIDENNYQLFKEYKFTFTKEEDTENLIFKQVELVK